MGLSARELGLKAVETRKNLAIFFEPTISEFDPPPNPFLPLSSAPETQPINIRTVVYGRLLGVLDAGPRMGNSRGPPDAREWHFRALGALASHSPRHGRPRLERPLLDAIGADPRASKPAELSTAAPKPGALIAPPPAQARPAFGPGHPRGAQPVPPQLALHGPLLVAFGAQLHKTKPTELPVGAPMPGALESTVSESRQHEPGLFRSPRAHVAHSPRHRSSHFTGR